MNLLPKASASRPRFACEIVPGGVVAGRSPAPGEPLSAVAKTALPERAVVPGLKPGNLPDRVAVIAALRRVLEQVGGRPNGRNAEVTVIIPDGAVRVLLLDFDALPAKLSEALPIVRFRLKKLVPFDADEAMVSFQIMSTSRTLIRVLAVAVPRDVLSEYETAVREAGFEPGAVLPSTLSALAALNEGEGAALLVNAHPLGVTTAIVRAGIVLLHRAVELADFGAPIPAGLPPVLFESQTVTEITIQTGANGNGNLLPLVDRDATEAEWAAQQPLPEHGRNPYEDDAFSTNGAHTFNMYASEAAPVARSPYASATVQQEFDAQLHNAPYMAPETLESALGADPRSAGDADRLPRRASDGGEEPGPQVHTLAPDIQSEETASAVSVAIAYFEDTLAAVPQVLLSAGPLGADALNRILREQGIAEEDGVRVRELLDASSLAQPAVSGQVARGWLAGIAGALRS